MMKEIRNNVVIFYIKRTLRMVDPYFPLDNMERLNSKETIEKLAKFGKAYEIISKELKDQHPDCYSSSKRSVRHFCRDNQIDKKSLIEKEKLDSLVKEEILQVIVYVFTFVK